MFRLIFIERQMKVCTLATFSSRITKLIWFESFPTYISALSLRNLCAEVSLKRLILLKQSFLFIFFLQDLILDDWVLEFTILRFLYLLIMFKTFEKNAIEFTLLNNANVDNRKKPPLPSHFRGIYIYLINWYSQYRKYFRAGLLTPQATLTNWHRYIWYLGIICFHMEI